MFKKKVIASLLTICLVIFSFNSAFATEDGQQLNQDEQIHLLIAKIQYLKQEVKDYDNKHNRVLLEDSSSPEENVNVALGGQISEEDNLQLDSYVDKVVDGSINEGSIEFLSKTFSRSVDVSNNIPITTRGEETYIGSYSSSNIIPFGRISQTLFPATIMGQRSNFGDYSVYLGSYIENDLQGWNASKVVGQNGKTLSPEGFGMYTTTVYMYFLANLGHYITFQTDIEFWQGVGGISDAFVMFGNIDDSPLFVTVGQYRPSIGSYSGGGTWSYGITTNLFRLNRVPNVALNYKDDTQTANITIFNNGDHPSFSLGYFNAVALNEIFQLGFNAGYAYDIHGANAAFENVGVKAGEFNLDATMNISTIFPGTWSIGTSWGTTTNKNTAFNGYSDSYAGAWSVQTAYSIPLLGRGTNFNFSYGHSYNANNLDTYIAPQEGEIVPTSGIQNQYIVSMQRAYFDNNVLLGPEYNRQTLYNHQFINTFTLDLSVYV